MYPTPWLNNINRSDILPPMTVRMNVKKGDKWQRAVMDSFEHIALIQFRENLKFWDYYRMLDGKMSYQELKEVIPQLENIQQLLDGVGIPSFLKHYDILGVIINSLVGKYLDIQDKFHVIDTGEIAQSEALRFKNELIWKALQDLIDAEVRLHMAKAGLKEDGQQFSSPEEQQAYMQQIEQQKAKYTPKDPEDAKKFTYKSIGIEWGEATLEKDKEAMNLGKMEKEEFKDYLLTGRCFREYKLGHDIYYPVTWSPKNTFIPKEITSEYAQDGEYIGRLQFYTPAEVIKIYGHFINADKQKELLGGNENWQNFVGDGVFSGTIEESINSNFGKVTEVPFANYFDYNFYLGLQDETGIPMGQTTIFNKDGSQTVADRYLPKMQNRNAGSYNNYAQILRDDFDHRRDLCVVTEVYFKAFELWGYLTYEDPTTGRVITEEVTEDILPQFLKDNGIKATYKESIEEIIESFELNTLKWVYKPVTYEGVKVQSGNLNEPLYLYCRAMKNQIKGDTDFDVKLPVAGKIGKALAPKIMPFQAGYNVCMNQIYNLLEKEIGMFFLLDVQLIPSEIEGWGDAQEAMITMRNLAKDIGIMPVQTSGDTQKNNNNFNQFSTYNLSYAPQMQSRIQLADVFKAKAYEVVGTNPQMFLQSTKYETQEGIRMNQEASFTQIAEIYEDFAVYNKGALELHLAVAQYAQSNKKDLSLYYTKSDASVKFLQISDPNFPLRRFGIMPSKDSKKKKELEGMKQYLMSTNTIREDVLDVARLMTSDTMTEVLDIAKKAREERMAQDQRAHQRNLEIEDKKSKDAQALEDYKFAHAKELEAERSRAKIIVGQLNAQGRAADKDANASSFEQISTTAEQALDYQAEQNKIQMHDKSLASKEDNSEKDRALKYAQLNQKAKEIEARLKISENAKTSSMINKN